MAAAGVSPSSSPRLPSPPPFTEVQIGPKSPSVGESFEKDAEQMLTGLEDDGLLRRIRPGTKAADMAFGPPLIPLSQVGLVHDNKGNVNSADISNFDSSIPPSSSKSILKLCIIISPNQRTPAQ